MKWLFILIILAVSLNCANNEVPSNFYKNSSIDLSQSEIYTSKQSLCPVDMVHIFGQYCPALEEVCLKWLDKPICTKTDPETKECLTMNPPMRCAEYKKPTICRGKSVPMNFCIDKYEFPNKLGEMPSLRNTWFEARDKCESLGKRLCIDNEWTQACRGNGNYPYPYGYERDSSACRIDLPWQDPTTHSFEQLNKTIASGSMPRCVSTYGVFDLTGNADEWARSSGGTPYQSVLKGGHPHGVRNRCSARTDSHNEYFTFYVTGFRCCKNL